MTTYPDPVYGEFPISVRTRWDQFLRPPLVNDPEMQAWRTVIAGAADEVLESSWLIRWRVVSPVTAEGVHLDAIGELLGFPRPDGWTEERYRDVVVPIEGAAPPTPRTVDVTRALANGLAVAPQVWELQQGGPLTYVVTFYELTDDEAITYRSVLEYGRPTAVRMVMAYSNVSKADSFVLDVSLLDGADVMLELAEI